MGGALRTVMQLFMYLKNRILSTKVTKLSLTVGLLLLVLCYIAFQRYLRLAKIERRKCENGQVYNECLAGCNNEKLLYVGDTDNCNQPGVACCDQLGSAYCDPQGLCSCRPGYEPHALEGIGRFKIICFVLGGQPCPKRYGYYNVDHDKLFNLLHNHSFPAHGERTVKEQKLLKLRTLLRDKIIKIGYAQTLFDWGCESGICNQGICEYGLNPYFE